MKKQLTFVMLSFALIATTVFAQSTPKEDVKQAGAEVKKAGKATGAAAKDTAKATKKETKKAANASAKTVKKGAQKVEDKTQK